MSMSSCEIFPDSFDTGTVSSSAVKIALWDHPNATLDEKWAAIISDYSGKCVTFRKDKLVALSGVARLLATKFRTTYVAGMWKEDLVAQLAWFAMEPSGTDIQDSMPSWTWPFVNMPVEMSRKVIFKEYVPLVSILEATIVVVGDDFGDVKEGTIRMTCRLPFIAGVVEEHENRWFIIRLGLYGPAFNFSLCPERT
jgi:hypothetical protein